MEKFIAFDDGRELLPLTFSNLFAIWGKVGYPKPSWTNYPQNLKLLSEHTWMIFLYISNMPLFKNPLGLKCEQCIDLPTYKIQFFIRKMGVSRIVLWTTWS